MKPRPEPAPEAPEAPGDGWREGMGQIAARFEGGDRAALLDAIRSAVARDGAMPDAMRRAIVNGLDDYAFDRAPSLEAALGIDRPRIEKRKRAFCRGFIYRQVRDLMAREVPIDEAFRQVADEANKERLCGVTWSKTTVQTVYYEVHAVRYRPAGPPE